MFSYAGGFPRCAKCNCQFYPRAPSDCAPVPGARVETNDLCNNCLYSLRSQTGQLQAWEAPYNLRGPQC